jgi:hypothetical protein
VKTGEKGYLFNPAKKTKTTFGAVFSLLIVYNEFYQGPCYFSDIRVPEDVWAVSRPGREEWRPPAGRVWPPDGRGQPTRPTRQPAGPHPPRSGSSQRSYHSRLPNFQVVDFTLYMEQEREKEEHPSPPSPDLKEPQRAITEKIN